MIIDALTHVTRDGRWFDTEYDASEARLLRELDAARVDSAVVCGLPGVIDNSFVLDVARRQPDRVLPVGSFDPSAWSGSRELRDAAQRELRDTGLLGCKLHPRLGRYDLLDASVRRFLEELASWKSAPALWICTFLHHSSSPLSKGVVETLHEIVVTYPTLRFVLAHAGGPDCLRLATAVRHSSNAIMDLSYTLVRFAGSSVDLDVRHLFDSFDRRLAFGSDFPEVPITSARVRIDEHLHNAKPDVAARVLGTNLLRFLSLEHDGLV
jgi:predicted TIM-barrel fold metal-dependent hydrolase